MTKPITVVSELPAGAVAESRQIATLVEVLEGGEVIETITEAIDGTSRWTRLRPRDHDST